MNSSSQRRVVIVDRHLLYADSVRVALSLRGHRCFVQVTGGLTTAGQALAGVRRARADVALMDHDLSHIWEGMDLIEPVAGSGAAVVVVTGSPDPVSCREALRRGARGVLPKSSTLDTVSGAIEQVTTGGALLPISPPEAVTGQHPQGDAEHDALRARLQRLTGRENEILADLLTGRSVSEIARASVVSEATVRTQVGSILTKLEVSSQLAAVGIVHRLGWWTPVSEAHSRWAASSPGSRLTG